MGDYPVVKSKYEVTDLLNEDLISYCYKGRTLRTHSPVHIWKFKSDYVSTALVRKLIGIADKVMSIQDDRLLKMIDYAYDGKFFYTIHESVEGMVTLESFIKEKSNWDLKTLWRISTQVLSVMIKIESRDLVCGGINLNGIYMIPDGRVKLARVGIPLEVLRAGWDSFSVVEDCIFYPPEFLQSKVFSLRSDMYSFGVLLYLFFSRKWPYEYTLEVGQLKESILDGMRPFQKAHSRIPDRLSAVISRCMAIDPKDRFSNFVTLVKSYRGDLDFEALAPEVNEKSSMRKRLAQDLSRAVKERYRRWVKVGVVTVSLLVMFVVGRQLYVNYLTAIPEKLVPDVVGMSYEEAEELLSDRGLSVMIVGTRAHPFHPEGAVVESKPPSGRLVKENRKIRLFLSRGAGPVLVPDLVGHKQMTVMSLLDERGLGAEIVEEVFSIQYDEGIVVSQNPGSNSFINPSENVKLVLSKGFPLEYEVKKPRFAFFQEKNNARRVVFQLYILDEWEQQDVAVFFKHNGTKEKLYSDLHNPGETVSLDFELAIGGVIEIYFNNDRVFYKKITEKLESKISDESF